jgi:hypothetical protein
VSDIKRVLLMVGLAFAGACSDSYDPTPSASGVFPAEGFLGRHVRVEVSGEETKWADGATLSFGDGITVNNVVVASESAIFADLDIAPDAALSDRDVTVTSGSETDTLTGAFRTKSPIDFVVQGQTAQGSVAFFTVTNHDFDTPFDTTFTGDGFFTPIVYTNLSIDGGPGVTLQVSDVTAYTVSGVALFDVDAPATSAPITVVSGPSGGTQVTSPFGASLTIAPRTATVLASDTPATGSIAAPYDSALYAYTPTSAPELAALSISASNPNGAPSLVVLPASGHFADLLDVGDALNEVVGDNIYVIAYDLSGASGYSYELDNSASALQQAADTEPGNNDSTGATTITAPALIDNASLTLTDEDWFKVTVPAGKKIHVKTSPGDPYTDTFVDIYGPNNAATQFGECTDADYHEDFISSTTSVAGTYYIKISASQAGYFDPSQSHYTALVTIE